MTRHPAARAVAWVTNDGRRTLSAAAAVYVACSLLYALLEDKGPVEGLWWGIVTASTTGYGDYAPATTAGRAVGAVLMVSMWGLVFALGAHFTKQVMDDPDAWTDAEQRELAASLEAAAAERRELLLLVRHLVAQADGTAGMERLVARLEGEET